MPSVRPKAATDRQVPSASAAPVTTVRRRLRPRFRHAMPMVLAMVGVLLAQGLLGELRGRDGDVELDRRVGDAVYSPGFLVTVTVIVVGSSRPLICLTSPNTIVRTALVSLALRK